MNAIEVSRKSSVMTITLNNPDRGNALSPSMVQEINQALDRAEAKSQALVVFQGAGKHFCTGFDLSDLADVDDDILLSRIIQIELLLARIWSAPFLTLALAKGRTFGAGADLVASCDRRFAQTGASFSFPGAAFGLVLGTRRLGERIGRDTAQNLILSGGFLSDIDSLKAGLLHDLVSLPDEIEALIETETVTARRLNEVTRRQISQALNPDIAALDNDLANLVRSASVPGLKKRIEDYRASVMAAR
ncbi:MAG: enoyl-CoA hydratase/isomerase family protein [Alphaproteobacteria bacterium]|jgi:enoyl-CoA hydratase|nr:enoyl-CoA hydratase/isomerase family protein [Alphaproteobacteria bacterium]MBT4019044.1 enoyl-CoA hydratase/isomerase family protein [Alphaproteobacteria bacterium]MBT4966502.1 enoyl-CoA hydratase/isomerase family protein [Alphaproteobacteria bacterium]MBT5161708.1 enoyl-CoA hydratase/isomerase family protein [Alphaproteobacteria bacterium]MBT5919904.1 enoyl-CoA hydratase/isomerase family protein [Alphaproteobacteria bacterium]